MIKQRNSTLKQFQNSKYWSQLYDKKDIFPLLDLRKKEAISKAYSKEFSKEISYETIYSYSYCILSKKRGSAQQARGAVWMGSLADG